MKYVYPAVLKKDDDGYFISFPDLQNCFTEGEDLSDAIAMAEDVLCLTLYNMEITGESIPEPSDIKEIQPKENETITLICCDTMEYRTYYNSKAVKKTVSIPEWMNEEATAKGINFSALLQESIAEKLGYKVSDNKK
ncbi:type II toxin-antitoxin system HicB family antitoxin [Emergencia timonensis]|uniref:type II toxin-antitoxin system HicB family antitoxin n=1 Tax=Emergencia timonensis TaxID=1776384 RepID=UPI0008359FB9|nr:type II toxin-antitoxin system HicB family antitoxin [Emergencia timonensis]WNX87175.1 type II toxin-antitoxin system HicB family antitoxin [Emergencia timonensis]